MVKFVLRGNPQRLFGKYLFETYACILITYVFVAIRFLASYDLSEQNNKFGSVPLRNFSFFIIK